jgi:hypothetical protein
VASPCNTTSRKVASGSMEWLYNVGNSSVKLSSPTRCHARMNTLAHPQHKHG